MPDVSEADRKLLDLVKDSDVMILLFDKGAAGSAFFKGIEGRIPSNVEVMFGEKDDPPQTIRQVKVSAGWPRAEWRKLDRSGLHPAADEEAAA